MVTDNVTHFTSSEVKYRRRRSLEIEECTWTAEKNAINVISLNQKRK
jgi:hypothetical protein